MTPELTFLALTAVLVLLHVGTQGLLQKHERGNAWTIGPRDIPATTPAPLTGRAQRALGNLLETLPAFIAATLVLHLADTASPMTRGASVIYLTTRALYLPAYLSALPWVRTILWNTATAALAAVIIGIWWTP